MTDQVATCVCGAGRSSERRMGAGSRAAAPAAQALPAYGWAERRGQARGVYEKFVAVLNRQSIHMDEGTLDHARALQRCLNSVVSATVAL